MKEQKTHSNRESDILFDLVSVDFFSSTLIGPQSAPRAFLLRFPR